MNNKKIKKSELITDKILSDLGSEVMIIDDDFNTQIELSGFFRKIFRKVKRSFRPPRRYRKFFSKHWRGIKRFAKKAVPIIKKVVPVVIGALSPGVGAVVTGALNKIGGVTGKVKSLSRVSKMVGPKSRQGLVKVFTESGKKSKTGGSGLFKNRTDVVNKVVAFKSQVKPDDDIPTAMATGKSMGFTPKQTADIMVKDEVTVKDQKYNTKLFKYGSKDKFAVAKPVKEKKIKPEPVNVVITKKRKVPARRLFRPEYFESGSVPSAVGQALYLNDIDDVNLELKFLKTIFEKGKKVVKKVFPPKEEREAKRRKELADKKQLLLKNIITLEKNLKTLKNKFNLKRRWLTPAQDKSISKDILDVEKGVFKMKKELRDMSRPEMGQDSGLGFALTTTFVVLGVAGAIAYLGGKTADTVKMHKIIKRDADILDRIERGVITPAEAERVLAPKPRKPLFGVEIPIIPLALLGAGIILIPKLLRPRRKKNRYGVTGL